jgi:hypothetical protein
MGTRGEAGRHRRALIAIPVYNEEDHLERVLADMVQYSPEVLAVDDGSTDSSAAILDAHPFVEVRRQEEGPGAWLVNRCAGTMASSAPPRRLTTGAYGVYYAARPCAAGLTPVHARISRGECP